MDRAARLDRREVAAGAVFAAFGLFVVIEAQEYDRGTATQMGPGYFPTLLGGLLVLLGVIAIVQGARRPRALIGAWPYLPAVFVLGGVLAFAFLVRDHGLVPAVTAMVLLSCYDRVLRRPIEVAVLVVAMLLLAVGIFIYGIQLPLDLF